MDLIVKMQFGSHLYGTSTPDSDLDYKGVFMPEMRDLMLGRVPKSVSTSTKTDKDSKNTGEDVDTEIYSLHYFIKLACAGETVALDMLHAPAKMIVERTPLWGDIVTNRHRFYTRNLKAFIGYARRQAAKYGIKGSRLNDAERVLDYLNSIPGAKKLLAVWDGLPEGEHIFKHSASDEHNNLRLYEVCGRKVQETADVFYTRQVVNNFYVAYGERAKQAANNEGVDWKACSHAMRAAIQVKEILTEGTITFPLREAGLLRAIKEGKLDYQTAFAPRLEALMEEVEGLSQESELPDKVDKKWWDNFMVSHIGQHLFISGRIIDTDYLDKHTKKMQKMAIHNAKLQTINETMGFLRGAKRR